MCPTLLNPLQLPLQPIPLGCHGASALGSLCHIANSHCRSILYMVIYIFQCYSLKPSHGFLFPLCPKVCSLCLCLLCCCEHRIIGTIFLDSIYMHLYTIFIFLFLIYCVCFSMGKKQPGIGCFIRHGERV